MWIMITVLRDQGESLTRGDKVKFLNNTATVESVVLYSEIAEIQLMLDVKCSLVKIDDVVEPFYLEQLG
jgi:hypothetical protein